MKDNKLKLVISHSPHVHAKNSVKKIMYLVILAMIPTLLVSLAYFGIGALIVTLTAVLSAVFFEWVIQKYLLKVKPTISDGSAIITGMLLAFNVPSNLPLWMVIIGSLVAIGVAKMSFGGLGNNVFNPALVGRVFLLISFPVEMTSWPTPGGQNLTAYTDAVTGATPLGLMKEGLKNGETVSQLMSQIPDYWNMFIGHMGGSLGEMSALAILLGGLFLMWKKIINWQIPVSIMTTVLVFTGILHAVSPEKYADPLFHLLTGGLMLGAFFMATDMVTSPMTPKGMIIFGIGIGILVVVIRVWGAYPEGMSFAILIMNAFVPLINIYAKPKLYGEVKKNGK
jgi:electron transport complex protein RnfD